MPGARQRGDARLLIGLDPQANISFLDHGTFDRIMYDAIADPASGLA